MQNKKIIMISQIENELAPLRKQLVNHDLYKNLKSITDIKIFMEQHVFCGLGLYVSS